MELVGQPGRAVGVEVPADRVGAVFSEGVEGIDRVALGFGHLLSVLVQDQTQDDDVFIGGLVEKKCGDRVQGIEPAAGLVHRLTDEGSGEVLFKELLIFKRIVVLGERHGAGVKPAVDDLGHALHLSAAVRAFDKIVVHIRPVELGIGRGGIAGQVCQFFAASDADLLSAVRAFPDIERCAPVTVSGDTPVLDVLQPVSETAFADVGGDPVDLLVVADQVIADLCHLDKPGLTRIVEQRGVAAPAVRIVVLELRRGKEHSSGLQLF